LVEGTNHCFYGTFPGNGAYSSGTIFMVQTNGLVTLLVDFNPYNGTDNDGSRPNGLVLARDGNFYGTTFSGGPGNNGTFFRMSHDGRLTKLLNYNGLTGTEPTEVTEGPDGSFYGVTWWNGLYGQGNFTKITRDGSATALAGFGGTNRIYRLDGLMLGADGWFYGTVSQSAVADRGKVFRMVLFPRFTGITREPGGTRLELTGPANQAGGLWASSSPEAPFSSWMLLATNSFDSAGQWVFSDPTSNCARFYRATLR
jgi:uncharacterized repeat protein (TIGR03803 family)